MAEKNFLSEKTLLEKRIEQFCESHTLLMTNIYSRSKSRMKDVLKAESGTGHNEMISMSENDDGFHKGEGQDDLF